MKLIHTATGQPVKLGDEVTNSYGRKGIVNHFIPPHKPSSSGHVSIGLEGTMDGYNYVSVWGLEWIDREDRHPFIRDHKGGP